MSHPHPDRRHIMVVYRRYILSRKQRFGTARGLMHYRAIVDEYLEAKRDVLEHRS